MGEFGTVKVLYAGDPRLMRIEDAEARAAWLYLIRQELKMPPSSIFKEIDGRWMHFVAHEKCPGCSANGWLNWRLMDAHAKSMKHCAAVYGVPVARVSKHVKRVRLLGTLSGGLSTMLSETLNAKQAE